MGALPPVVWSDDVLQHEPGAEIWVGVRTPGTEVPERARILLAAVTDAGADVVAARPHGDELLLRVHDLDMVDHLRTVADDWAAGEYEALVGQDRVVPYFFPTAGMLDGLPSRLPTATHARAGVWCYDTMTLVGPGTWTAARAAVDVVADRRRPRRCRRACCLRAGPAARSPRHPPRVRRVVLPQQRRDRRRGAA